MSEFYEEMQGVASEVLAEFKQGVIRLVKITPGSGPVDAPGDPTIVNYVLDAVAGNVSWKLMQDSRVAASDLEVTASVLAGVVVSPDDFIEIDGVQHKIVADMSTPAAGTKVVWKFIVRAGG